MQDSGPAQQMWDDILEEETHRGWKMTDGKHEGRGKEREGACFMNGGTPTEDHSNKLFVMQHCPLSMKPYALCYSKLTMMSKQTRPNSSATLTLHGNCLHPSTCYLSMCAGQAPTNRAQGRTIPNLLWGPATSLQATSSTKICLSTCS